MNPFMRWLAEVKERDSREVLIDTIFIAAFAFMTIALVLLIVFGGGAWG